MSSSALGGYVAFVLFMGAAYNDAFEWQRKAIRDECSDHLQRMKSKDPAEGKQAMVDTLETVQKIMGQDWQPQGEWMTTIQNMLGGEHG